ncbi:hypothetical protein SAMN04488005_0168 [Yoonia tamlensis]|uniref:Membrane domain of glycerophosphoryl diester phosphodiesterase n=1 Tax=Yoonia tamlensis TaxID=390270 RepID=A0A1I6FP89_9RHOB|nr:hypothetical protein [Yoonia tamlensis]SFR31755.1 hypothetical protein SAMN04488005_0168 [Yoonia tamlensis]
MLVVRSFLFSFSILWRLCLVAPFLVVIFAIIGFIAALFLSVIALISPLIGGLIVISAGFAISSIFPIMLGARLGFQAMRVDAFHGYGKMFLFAMIYGFVEALAAGIIGGVAAVCITFFVGGFDMTMQGSAGLTFIIVTYVLIAGLRSVMLVPIAGAALGRDANGQLHTPFYGVGARGMALWVITICAMLLGLLGMAVFAYLSLSANTALANNLASWDPSDMVPTTFSWEAVAFIVGIYVISLWVFSWQAAAGVLVYLDQRDAFNERNTPKHSEEDRAAARDLWRQRMPPGGH